MATLAPMVSMPDPVELFFAGERHVLRCLNLDDTDRLIAFFNSHNEETVRLRYGYFFKEMTVARARELVGVDQCRDLALALFSFGAEGEPVIDAIGRYFLLPSGRSAEMAFIVRETKRRLGMAQTLLRALAATARVRGLTKLVAQVQRENRGMIALFRKEGATVKSNLGADAVDISLPLKPVRKRSHA
ncbi:MAG: GNAT family N-acetyltransferase [Opitutaceae bacterium]|nr:GNAT family N-acetyltransferase [Opitutaceae bacterium]